MAVKIPPTGTHVYFEWEDSEGRKGGDEPVWTSAERVIQECEPQNPDDEYCCSTGWILAKTRTRIVLVSDVAPGDSAEISRDMYIPKSAIRLISEEVPPLAIHKSGAVRKSRSMRVSRSSTPKD